MVKVYNIGVLVFQRGVPVRMAVRLWPFPAVVRVLMVTIMNVEMLMPDRFMHVL